ncbi:hypothetical protein C0995_006263 [Termitomyces sp. Mi166|nr:hypothetical protein C0995_006263 [Termitomyces sp. Mi166\
MSNSNLSTQKISRVSFASLTPNNLGTVRKLNSVLFPIKYGEKFYQGVLLPQVEDFCKLIYYNDVPPYRSRSLGSQALELILASAVAQRKPKISKIYLHVQVSNHGAKMFYERHGFKEVGVHENYYKKINPHDAWILEKTLS